MRKEEVIYQLEQITGNLPVVMIVHGEEIPIAEIKFIRGNYIAIGD